MKTALFKMRNNGRQEGKGGSFYMGQLAAVVLAAGVSSRMGKFKPMLFVDGNLNP